MCVSQKSSRDLITTSFSQHSPATPMSGSANQRYNYLSQAKEKESKWSLTVFLGLIPPRDLERM